MTAPVYSGTDVVGVLEVTTALAIQLCKFKWVPSGEKRVVAQIYFKGWGCLISGHPSISRLRGGLAVLL